MSLSSKFRFKLPFKISLCNYRYSKCTITMCSGYWIYCSLCNSKCKVGVKCLEHQGLPQHCPNVKIVGDYKPGEDEKVDKTVKELALNIRLCKKM